MWWIRPSWIRNVGEGFCFCCCLLFLKLIYRLSKPTCFFFLVLWLIYRNCFGSICFMYFHLVTYSSQNYNLFWCGSIQQLHYILGLVDVLFYVTFLARSACLLCSLQSLSHLVRILAPYQNILSSARFSFLSQFQLKEVNSCTWSHLQVMKSMSGFTALFWILKIRAFHEGQW